MDRTISNAVSGLRSFENQIQQTENKMSQASKEVGQLKDELSKLDDVDATNLSSMFDDLDIGDFTGQIDGLDGALDLLGGGARACGLALAGMFTASVIDGAKSFDKAITDLEINLGVTEKQAESLHKKIKDFSDGGYNVGSISEGVELLTQTMSLTDEEMEKVTKGMSIMNDRGYETSDMVRFMQMAYNNWGMDATDALGMIIRGQQEGMNIAGDYMDTLIEYTPIFSQFGVDGKQAFALISQAMRDTGMDSDKVADMMKEVFLTITDGSDASKEALASVGIDVDDLKSRIDSGEITMVDAFNEVNKAILGVGDETKRAQALQDIYKGTVEYGNQTVLESWLNVKDGALDTAGAIDEVTGAYEGSYEASQQDFSNSWNELKQTIGSGVLPILTTVMDTFNLLFTSVGLGVSSVVLNVQTMANQLKAFFQEIHISILETFVDNPIAEKLFPGMEERLVAAKTQHEKTINYIQENERKLVENAKASDELYKGSKTQTYDEVKNIADQKTKETSNVIDSNTKDGANKAKNNMYAMKNDVENSLSGLGSIALTSTGEIPKATQQNLNASSQIIKQFGSDAYNGVKTSFSKLEQSAKQSMSNLYNGVSTSMSKTKTNVMQDATTMYNQSKKSFTALEQSAKSSFSSLYNGCSNSVEQLKNSVLADWNTMKNTISKGITGKVTVTRTNITQNKTEKASLGLMEDVNSSMATLARDTQAIDFYGSTYKATPIASKATKNVEKMNNSLLKETQQQNKLLTELLSAIMAERTTVVENTINLDGKQIAKGTVRYMESEITNMNNRKNRLAGAY